MRGIPSSIAQKIKKAFQTQYNNADPRIELVIQRTKKYIEEGAALQPYTVHENAGLGAIDLALRREDPKKAPDKVYMIHIQSGVAKVSCIDYISAVEKKEEWEPLFDLGPAVDVASEFDGFWMRTSPDAEVCFDSPANWTHVTRGEPWFFLVLPNGSLVAKQGEHGAPVTLASQGVSKVSAIRGWKSVVLPVNDQGLIAAYIKNDTVCYRSYAEQANGLWIWESEKTVPEFTGTAQNIAAFRTNDFRVGFIAEISGEIQWAVTRRDWAGMGIQADIIRCSLSDYHLQLFGLLHSVVGDGPYPTNDARHQKDRWYWGEYNREKIGASITDYAIGPLLWGGETVPVQIENIPVTDIVIGEEVGEGDGETSVFKLLHVPGEGTEVIYVSDMPVEHYTIEGKELFFDVTPGAGVKITADYEWQNFGKRIKITFNHGITNISGHQARFTVTDEQSLVYLVSGTSGGEPWYPSPPVNKFDGTCELIMNVADFNAAGFISGEQNEAEITVEYEQPGLKGEAGQQVGSFVKRFIAVNLDPKDIPPPEVEVIWNE